MIVVSDRTPLRHLIAIGEAELLPKLYGTVIVPGAVWAELQAEATPLTVKTWLGLRPTALRYVPRTQSSQMSQLSMSWIPASGRQSDLRRNCAQIYS
jgi:predicted nucleic acid-binding protein